MPKKSDLITQIRVVYPGNSVSRVEFQRNYEIHQRQLETMSNTFSTRHPKVMKVFKRQTRNKLQAKKWNKARMNDNIVHQNLKVLKALIEMKQCKGRFPPKPPPQKCTSDQRLLQTILLIVLMENLLCAPAINSVNERNTSAKRS